MKKMWTVLRREYLSRVKTKGFVIGTILLPLFMLAIFILPTLFMFLKSDKPKQIAVIDLTGMVFDSLFVTLSDTNQAGQRLYNFVKHQIAAEDLEATKERLRAAVNQKGLDGFIVIPANIFEDGTAEYQAKSVSNFRENEAIRDAINRVVTDTRIRRSGLDTETIRQMVRRIKFTTKRVTPEGKEEKDEGFTFAIAYFLGFFIYMSMFIYGAIVMRSVIEEKTSRVVESVVSSVKPFQLMAGKIFGVGAVGLTQFLIWAIVMGLLSLYGLQVVGLFAPKMAGAQNIDLPSVSLGVLGFFVIFFVLGYFLYSTLYAGIGAMVNSDQEAQQLLIPVSLFIVVPILLMTYIIGNPSSQTAVILSLVPFFAPIIMLARIVVEMPPLWQIVVCLAIMVVTILGLIWIVGRIYRVGVLMYGKRPTLPEIIKWIKYA
ncbi:MAG: ABC transporter permease [candidate division KSB1 bacterium]|nr:ABC transporter permease [candidate division KSB1 bacterium]MDZ7301484.1 ABC transporter permease [candidate division KSB1 bacterium]MDZ7310886.1 ABC transporter permease [candidate division KSB1 bacterium]